ncbi:MAG: beta-lactamase family protein [Epsilonproteobacteria bacterium]|nr:beta-lactamase family protein [Campylobacterota bacterium]
MKLKCKTIKRIPLIASVAFLVGCTTEPEPKAFTSEVDPYAYVKSYMQWYIKNKMDDNEIMGLSIALVDDQKIVWSEGFGYADKAKGIKATPQTKYCAGSITKLFTDMGTMKLAEEGKINIDKPFKKYLPAFSIKSRFGSTDAITPRNIMTHHSGLPGDWGSTEFGINPLPYTEYVNAIKDEYVAYAPNTILSYSNLALTLLGHAVENVSGMKYSQYIEKSLFSPLEMKHADLEMKLEGDLASKSYKEGKEVVEYADGLVPAGALHVSVEELSHLVMMINANGVYNHHRVLKASTLKKMFTVQNKNIALDLDTEIGLGYFIDKNILGTQDVAYHHGGNTVAQNAYFIVSPNSKLGVVVMANTAGIDATDIARELLKKAWEAKMDKKAPKQELVINHDSDFEGTYATVLGKVEIVKSGDGSYEAKTDDGSFTLNKTKENIYKAKYKLLGFVPIGNDDLDKVSLYTDEIEGHHVIVAYMNGGRFIGGVKVEKPAKISEDWKSYVGQYRVLNNYQVKEWQIKDVEFVIENGYPLVKMKFQSGDIGTAILKPISDTEVLIEGLGRSMQETVYLKDGIIHAQGFRFEKIAGEK